MMMYQVILLACSSVATRTGLVEDVLSGKNQDPKYAYIIWLYTSVELVTVVSFSTVLSLLCPPIQLLIQSTI
jgi:hypothetical protein